MTKPDYYMVLVKLSVGWSLDCAVFDKKEAMQARKDLMDEGFKSIATISCQYGEASSVLKRYGINYND